MRQGQDVLTWLPQALRCSFSDSSVEGVRERESGTHGKVSQALMPSPPPLNFLCFMMTVDTRRHIFECGELFIVVFKFDLTDVYLLQNIINPEQNNPPASQHSSGQISKLLIDSHTLENTTSFIDQEI